ncbi:MAG: DNA repair exonuclease [Acetobacteraceae bacterium]
MTSFRFLHAADLHLDSPLRGLEADAPAERIRGATRHALVNMVDLALEEQVAFVLLAGDLYDVDWKDWHTGHFLIEQLGRLKRQGIPVVAISGNHDAEQVLTKRLPFPGVLLPSAKPGTHLLPGLDVAVHGQSFAKRAVTDNLALNYPSPLDGHFNIGLLHTACGSSEHENYAPCTPADLAARGYDYWALGHVHERTILSRDPWIVFPGNLQGRHVREEGAKGASIVQVVDGKVVAAAPYPLDVLRWRRLTVDVTGAADLPAVLGRAQLVLAGAVTEADGRFLALRLTLEGACPAHRELARDPAATREAIRAAVGFEVADRETLWIEDVRLHTRPALDLAALRAQPGAVGTLVAAIEGPAALDEDIGAFVRTLLKDTGDLLDPDHPARAILDGRLPQDLLDRARALLLAELAGR